MTGTKFETIRMIWLKDETGTLNCPQVEVYSDANKSAKAGDMNHEQWVEIVEEKGAMTKVKRRSDKMEAWIETKYLKRVYTKDDIQRGPSSPAPKDDGSQPPPTKSSGKDDEWD